VKREEQELLEVFQTGRVEATIPPAILFDRYFRKQPLCPLYRGKHDLRELRPELASFLIAIQNALNEALLNENRQTPQHVDHPPFYFDYIDSDCLNALAVRDSDYSYIGITMPLVYALWDSCVELSKSSGVGALLQLAPAPEREEAILTVMFQNQLIFVVTHEYTHHVHGHLSDLESGSVFSDEIVTSDDLGNLKSQAFEMDADGYAVYLTLAHLIAGPRREQAVKVLNCEHVHPDAQDGILFLTFVMSIGAFLLALSPRSVNLSKFCTRTHPFPAARMDWIMHHATNWCRQNDRSHLVKMASNTFQALMAIVEKAIRPENDWREQFTFLKSGVGLKYRWELRSLVKAYVEALPATASKSSASSR
jgi:hypothetical protein